MSKWEKLNMPLRTVVLQHSIRQEQTSSEIIKALLRILKSKTKTLGNKSSSLSFKNKIDLLHDLEELTDEEYNQLIKFMEIRNQFIHNHECSSFIQLGGANAELTTYLRKQFPNDEKDEEKSLLESYKQLFIRCQGKLLVMEREFVAGLRTDYEKHMHNQLMKRFDEVIERTKQNWRDNNTNQKFARPFSLNNPETDIESFILSLRLTISQVNGEIIEGLEGEGKMKEVFKRKTTIEELIALREKDIKQQPTGSSNETTTSSDEH